MPAKSIFCGSKLSSRSNTLLKSAIRGPKLQCGSLSHCSSLLFSVIYMNYTIKWGMKNNYLSCYIWRNIFSMVPMENKGNFYDHDLFPGSTRGRLEAISLPDMFCSLDELFFYLHAWLFFVDLLLLVEARRRVFWVSPLYACGFKWWPVAVGEIHRWNYCEGGARP